MPTITALYDANVLYSAPLRDALMHLALSPLVEAKWTQTIQAEWLRNVLDNRPDLEPSKLEHTQALMNQAVPNAIVHGFEDLIETLVLPDPDDRHVLAAAIHCRANFIVTANLKDFPQFALEPHGIKALHPDDFLCHLLEIRPAIVINALRVQREAMRHPPMNTETFLQMLEGQGLRVTVQRLEPFAVLL